MGLLTLIVTPAHNRCTHLTNSQHLLLCAAEGSYWITDKIVCRSHMGLLTRLCVPCVCARALLPCIATVRCFSPALLRAHSTTGQVQYEMALDSTSRAPDAATEDILARLEQQQLHLKSTSTAPTQYKRGAGRQVPCLSEESACSVCTGPTTETTQCPRCVAGKPAVHKMCEDEWLMRNKICIFCRLPVRRTATKSAAASSGTGAGQLGDGGGMIFSYRSPRNKGLSALLAALRKEASVGAQVGAELSERERQNAAKKDAALLPLRGDGLPALGLLGGPRKAHTATTQKSKGGKGKGGGGVN